MTQKNSFPVSRQNGFTLVEIMVGLVIGMLASLVIVQVLSVFETQKRSTTGSADAQTNGSIALYTINSELQMAGYPLMPATNSPLECTTLTYGATGKTGISPITITDGGAAGSDTLTIRYGDSVMGGVQTQIGALGTPTTVTSNLGCQVGDFVMATNGTTCAMTTVTALSAAGVAPVTVSLQNTTATAVGGSLACLGPNWNEVTYAVVGGNLQRSGIDSVAGIVGIQAQYGISAAANSNQVTQWVEATAATGWNAPSVANRNRIKAVRIAVIARNPKMETGVVTTACSSTTTAAPTGLCAWAGSTPSPAPAIDLSADANWQKYRYRVFETIIPLRNMIWAKDTL
jgi:type IV pilus assembly protein PilW